MNTQQKHDMMNQGLIATPSIIGVLWTKVLNLPVATWVGLFSIAFIGLQICHLIWKWRVEWKDRKERKDAEAKASLPQQ